jgi:hypothetical protein
MDNFPSLLEGALVNIWGGAGERLSNRQLIDTRRSLSRIRAIYRFKGEHGTRQPSNMNYKTKSSRAGYLAAFGERHGYLSYLHLKNVQAKSPDAIPKPRGRKNELVITSLGAGACIELFGICLFYVGDSNQPLYIKLNAVEKEREWGANRLYVIHRVMKESFPKLDVDPEDINADLKKEDTIVKLAQFYDNLIETDILLIYNVMNEIPTTYAKRVWKNIKFLLDIFQKPTLILLMEPSAERAEPRIYWLKKLIIQETELIETNKDKLFAFDTQPVCINMDSAEECLNYRLFGTRIEGAKPTFETAIRRSNLACFKKPNSPITYEQVMSQLASLDIKRGRRGAFLPRHSQTERRYSFGDIDEQWKF